MRAGSAYLLLCSILVLGCTRDKGSPNRGNFPKAIGKIMETRCATTGCHNAASNAAANGLNLSTWNDLFAGSGSGSPVIPFSSRFSSLCYFINTYPELGLQNLPTMPVNGNKLSYDEVKQVKDWIDAGAPDLNGNVKWADKPLRKKLYAVNQGCDVVTVFDSETQLPIRYIDVGTKPGNDTPHHVRVSPDGKYWYVVFINNNVMQKFRCSDDSYVGEIPLTPFAAGQSTNPQNDAGDWNTFVISSDGKRAYCVSWSRVGKVAAVDLENRKLLHYLSGFYEPHGIALNRQENKVYVTAQYGNYITELDTGFASSPVDWSLQNGQPPQQGVPIEPHDIVLMPDGQNFLITCQKSNDVRRFNILTGSVTAVVATGTYPQEIVFSPTRNHYFITCTNDTQDGATGAVSRIDGATLAHTKIKCGFQPHGLAVDEASGLLYVLSRNQLSSGPLPHHVSQCQGRNGFVNFVDLNTFTVLKKKYELSVDPYFIFARP